MTWKRSLGRPHVVSLGGVALESGLSLVASVLVARLLLPDARGELGRWIYWAGVATGLSGLGMSTALPQMVGAQRLSVREARGVFTLLAVTLAPAGAVLGMLLTGLACPGTTSRTGWDWMLWASVPGGILATVGYGMLVAMGHIRTLMATRVVAALLRVLSVMTLLVLGLRSVTLTATITALAIAGTGVMLTIFARPTIPTPGGREALGPLLARGGAIHLPAVMAIALTVINYGWVYARLSSGDAGLFAVAAAAATTLQLVSLAELTASTVPMSDPKDGWANVRVAVRRASALSGLGVVGGVLIAPVAVPLVYGAAYGPAVPAFCLLVTATGIENVGRVGQGALQCRGFPKTAWLVFAARAVGLLGCMVGFGARRGLVGVALSTALAEVAGLCACVWTLLVARSRSLEMAER